MTSLDCLDEATIDLVGQRSRSACVVYRDHPLPPGCDPDRADLGIESPAGGTLLHVRRGVAYSGDDEEVASWVRDGTRRFDTPARAIAWLTRRLAGAQPDDGRPAQEPRPAPPEPPVRLPAEEVTDVGAIDISAPSPPSLDTLRASLAAEVLGQDRAVEGLAELVSRHVVKPFPRRPASALLVGPTGTGKTLAAERLAAELASATGSPWVYRRVDMNEFSEQHSASRLFGAPPGYVGYGNDDNLASALRENPNTVVLFDEIDKAHPQLWRSLMNLMDAGRLATGSGDVDARRAVLLFTSNKDAGAIQAVAGQPDARQRAFLRERGYPPEIVGRMGRVLVFSPLPASITGRMLVLTVQRVVEAYGLQLVHIAPSAVSALAVDAPLPTGGRDLEYHVERILGAPLADIAGTGAAIRIDESLQVVAAGG